MRAHPDFNSNAGTFPGPCRPRISFLRVGGYNPAAQQQANS
jgi:hypothetical protein